MLYITYNIGRRIADHTGDRRSTSFLFQALGVANQRGNAASIIGTVEIPWAEGRGIRKSSRVVMRAGMEAEGRNVSPDDHEGGFSIPLAEGPWDFHSHLWYK